MGPMMKPVSMKRSAKEKKADAPSTAIGKGPDYGWGLSLNLEHDHLVKLGIKGMPAAGGSVRLSGRAKVTSSSVHDDEGGKGPRRSLGLQITHLALEKPATVAVRRVAGTPAAAVAAPAKVIKTKRA